MMANFAEKGMVNFGTKFSQLLVIIMLIKARERKVFHMPGGSE